MTLVNIRQAGADIGYLTEGAALYSYLEDKMMQAAIQCHFAIIEKALRRLHRAHPEPAAWISRRAWVSRICAPCRVTDQERVEASAYGPISRATCCLRA